MENTQDDRFTRIYEIIDQNVGKIIAIRGHELVGVYATVDEALHENPEPYENSTWLIRGGWPEGHWCGNPTDIFGNTVFI